MQQHHTISPAQPLADEAILPDSSDWRNPPILLQRHQTVQQGLLRSGAPACWSGMWNKVDQQTTHALWLPLSHRTGHENLYQLSNPRAWNFHVTTTGTIQEVWAVGNVELGQVFLEKMRRTGSDGRTQRHCTEISPIK